MRNLKKILALVLALVMSLSLMATAGAGSFQDVTDDNPYKTAIDVLDQLKVFQGFEDGTFKPTDTLNRAQAAVLVYRIATGDVEGKQVDNYTYMAQSKFVDLDGYNWAKGHINYCQNAGIVVGTDATHFNPGGKVTGYQLLVMLLRTLGYGKAGEFTDPKGWELQTATIAEREGITKNVTGGDFGAAAPRQMVAEILFQGLLQETVQYSALVPGGYTKSGETLGYKNLKLRDVTGIVTANKWANLYGDSVLADGQTNVILTGEEKSTRIGIDTELNDLGEVRHFYLTGAVGAKEANFIAYDQDGVVNNTYSNAGAAAKVSDSKIDVTKDTEQFLNFGYDTEGKSEYRLEYSVTFDNSKVFDKMTSQEWFADKYGVDPDDVIAVNGNTRLDTEEVDGNTVTYTRVIPRNDGISAKDIAIMEGIFSVADDDTTKSAGIDGYVFAGTNSSADVKRNLDLSDEMEWNEFYNTYIASRANTKISTVENGEWLKVVDNNNDGVAEYVFKTEFWMDEALNTYTLKGETYLDYYKLDEHSDDYDVRYIDEIGVGDVVVYTLIDGKANVCKAEPVPATVKDVLYKTVEIVTTEDETKGQSGITNDTEMDDNILNMADKTEYELFLDEFGFVRAYKLPGGTQYGLVTEAYYGFGQNGAFVQNKNITVELGLGEEELTEYNLSNAKDNVLVAPVAYSGVYARNNIVLENYLQPAIAHLGEDAFQGVPGFGTPFEHIWGEEREVVEIDDLADAVGNEWPTFDYGALTAAQVGADIDHYASMTNIAVVSGLTDDSVTLNGAAKYAYDKTTGERLYRVYDADTTDGVDGTVSGAFKLNEKVTQDEWEKAYIKETNDTENATTMFNAYVADENLIPAYAVDYIQLDRSESIAKGDRHYEIDDHNTENTNYKTLNNKYVNATHDTQYYIVGADGHSYFTDYANVTAIDASNILAAYAVARDTEADKDSVPYWVADVIVIEVKDWTDESVHSISLAYFEPKKSSDRVHYVETLNNESEDPMLTIVEKKSWGSNWKTGDYGFYQMINAEMDGDELLVGAVKHITKDNYNANGIYAGTFLRTRTINNKGGYVDVQLNASLGGDYVGQPEVAITMAPIYTIDSNSATQISWSSVDEGDHLIFVVDMDKEITKFVIHLGTDNGVNYLSARPKTPNWLWADYAEISEEQGWTGGDPESVECLIAAAKWLLDADAEPSLYQLRQSKAALERISADGSGYKLTPAQLAEITTAGTGLIDRLGDEIETAADEALDAKQTVAKALADKRAEGYTDYDAVSTALDALKDAIDAIDELGENGSLGTIYDGVKLNPKDDDVAALDAAIAVAKDGEKAIAAAKALIKEKNGTDDMTLYPETKAAYDALEAAIKAVADADALEDIYANGALVEGQAEVDALIDVLPEAPISQGDADLLKAIAEAKSAIDTEFGITEDLGKVDAVADAKAALVTALDGCKTPEALAEFYNTSTKKFVVTNENEAKELKEAVDTAKAQAIKDAADAALGEAESALNAVASWNVTVKAATKTAAQTAAEAAIKKIATDELADSAVAINVEFTLTANTLDNLDHTENGKVDAAAFTIKLTAAGTTTEKTISGKTSEVVWYMTEDAIKEAVETAIESVETSITTGSYAQVSDVTAAIKTQIATVDGIEEADVTVNTEVANLAAGPFAFTYTFTYAKGVTGYEVAVTQAIDGSITLGA